MSNEYTENLNTFSTVEDYLEVYAPIVLNDGELAALKDLGNTRAIIQESTGYIFIRDNADSTSAHNPAAGIIVDSSGTRFKSTEVKYAFKNVQGIQNDPPNAPTTGHTYVVGDVPTGAWANQRRKVALFSKWGWLFFTMETGTQLYVIAKSNFYFLAGDGAWKPLLPAADNFAYGNLSLQGITKDPPANPAVGDLYIVAANPTGIFRGQTNKIARAIGGNAFIFRDAYDGLEVYNRGNNNQGIQGYWRFLNGTWQVIPDSQPLLSFTSISTTLADWDEDSNNDRDLFMDASIFNRTIPNRCDVIEIDANLEGRFNATGIPGNNVNNFDVDLQYRLFFGSNAPVSFNIIDGGYIGNAPTGDYGINARGSIVIDVSQYRNWVGRFILRSNTRTLSITSISGLITYKEFANSLI